MKTVYGILSIVILGIVVIGSAFGESDSKNHSIAYIQAGTEMLIQDSMTNPYDHSATATIEYVFKDVNSGNHWNTRQDSTKVDANAKFSASQSYFVRNTGTFFIQSVFKTDGKVTEDSNIKEFVVFKKYSKAALEGCSAEHQYLVKPDYSKAVCVFDDSVDKLIQRGWIGKTY